MFAVAHKWMIKGEKKEWNICETSKSLFEKHNKN